MGRLSRFVANVVTLGAIGKVDKAMEAYKYTVDTHNKYIEEFKVLQDDTIALKERLDEFKKFIKSNKRTVIAAYKNEEFYNKLSGSEQNYLQSYSQSLELVDIPCDEVNNHVGISMYDHDAVNDLAISLATVAIPIVGVLAAHWTADDDVKKINEEKEKVVEKIEDIEGKIENLSAFGNREF